MMAINTSAVTLDTVLNPNALVAADADHAFNAVTAHAHMTDKNLVVTASWHTSDVNRHKYSPNTMQIIPNAAGLVTHTLVHTNKYDANSPYDLFKYATSPPADGMDIANSA